ncbi:MAG: 2Fe-2S iron-sulfur cluster-binding protein [Chloroflexota bacterium]
MGSGEPVATVTLTVLNGVERHELPVPVGSNLRQVLLNHALSPYAALTQRANCGGRGLCATCGVWLEEAPTPSHWHDKLAHQFGYPRLSCQITVDRDLTVSLIPEKWIWGGRQR